MRAVVIAACVLWTAVAAAAAPFVVPGVIVAPVAVAATAPTPAWFSAKITAGRYVHVTTGPADFLRWMPSSGAAMVQVFDAGARCSGRVRIGDGRPVRAMNLHVTRGLCVRSASAGVVAWRWAK